MQMLTVQTVPAQVKEYNLDKIIAYAVKKNSNLAEQNLSSLKEEYINFMYLSSIADKPIAVPSDLVDQVFHAHLLHNRDYGKFCELLGKVIFHNPNDDQTTNQHKANTMQNLVNLSIQVFGENVFTIKGGDCSGSQCVSGESVYSSLESDCNVPVSCSASCDGSSDDGD